MVFEMSNTPERGLYRASKRLAIRGVGQLLAFDAIFLRRECEADICGG